MKKRKFPTTPAVRFLRQHRIDFHPHLYPYEERGGAMQAAAVLDLSPRSVIKTLVFDTSGNETILMLMHGDREVSTRRLGRALGVKHVSPCEPGSAEKHTGYKVGGISPFGTRQAMPVFAEASIFQLEHIYINGGKRGFLVEIAPRALRETLNARPVLAAVGDDTK
jgi:Cys-tRNA(Pro) deacylase